MLHNKQFMDCSQIKIKNSLGEFVNFSGVRETKHQCYLKFTLDNGDDIISSLNHKFIVNDKEIIAKDLCVFDKISKTRTIIDIEFKNEQIMLYDPVEVSQTSAYIHDSGIISHNCNFIGSSNTLIDSPTLLSLSAREPIEIHNLVKYYAEPVTNHKYIMTCDVSKGRGQDYSTFNIIDISVEPFNQVAVYRNNNISPLLFPDVIVRTAKLYNEALVIIENNDAGHVVCNAVYHEYEYENTFVESAVKSCGIGCTMTKRVKRLGCSNLKDIVERGKLQINDSDTIQELSSFEAKGGSYQAAGDSNDDLVMNLVLFSWFASTDMFSESAAVDLKDLLYSERIREMEDDVVPFGIMPLDINDQLDNSHYDIMRAEQEEWAQL